MASVDTATLPYAKYSRPSAEFEPDQAKIKKDFSILWAKPLKDARAIFTNTPPILPDYTPTGITITHEQVTVTDGTKVEIRIYKSPTVPINAPLFFVTHGGGWVCGSHGTEEAQNLIVAGRRKVVVVSVDYRLAPEFKYPVPLDDCFDVFKWCISNAKTLGINPTKIVVGGSSAGGNLAAALCQKARDQYISAIIGQVLNIPVLCHPKLFPTEHYEYTSYEQNKDAPVTDGPLMQWFWALYLPFEERDAYASPLLAKSFEGLPPTLVQVAGMDPLRDEGIAYAQGLKEAGVPVTLRIFPGVPHGFYMFPKLQATKEYLNNVADFIASLV